MTASKWASSIISILVTIASCETKKLKYPCSANSGYVEVEYENCPVPSCVDVDECALPKGDSRADKCQHFCTNRPGSYECTCDYGYKLNLVDNTTCVYKCTDPETEIWSQSHGCVSRLKPCAAADAIHGRPDKAAFANVEMIGSGYDAIRGDPLFNGSDPGLRRKIFGIATIDDATNTCSLMGYEYSPGMYCNTASETMIFHSTKELVDALEIFAEMADTKWPSSLPSITVTETMDTGSTADVSCDRGSESSRGYSRNKGTSLGITGVCSYERSRAMEKGRSTTDSVASESSKPSSTSTETSSSSSESSSSTNSNSRTRDFKVDEGSTVDMKPLLRASYTNSRGWSESRGSQKYYTIQGFKGAHSGSTTVTDSMKFHHSLKGVITLSVAGCIINKAKMNKFNSLPPFTEEFVSRVRELHDFTSLVGHLAGDPDLEYLYDKAFMNFIATFGTHYLTQVTMGARLNVKQHFLQEELDRFGEKELKTCTEAELQKEYDHSDTKNCSVPSTSITSTDSSSFERLTITSQGSRLQTDSVEWSAQEFDSPVPVGFQLAPILHLFTNHFMSIDRIATEDDKPIDYELILSWFAPRYERLCEGGDDAVGTNPLLPVESGICVDTSKLTNKVTWSEWSDWDRSSCYEKKMELSVLKTKLMERMRLCHGEGCTAEIGNEQQGCLEDKNVLTDLVTQFQQELGATKDKLETTEERLGATKDKLVTTEAKLGATNTKLSTIEAKLSTIEAMLGKTKANLGATKDKLETTEERLGATKDKLETTEDNMDKLQGEMEETQRKLEAKTKREGELLKKLKPIVNNDLWQAANDGNVDLIKSALDSGADVDFKKREEVRIPDPNGRTYYIYMNPTPLILASARGHLRAVEYLISHGSNVDSTEDKYGTTSLMAAARHGHQEVISLLLDNEADINALDNSNGNALFYASFSGFPSCVRLLLQRGADAAVKDILGRTAFSYAGNRNPSQKEAVRRVFNEFGINQ